MPTKPTYTIFGILALALLGAASTPPEPVVATVQHWGGEVEVEQGADLTLRMHIPGAAEDAVPGWDCWDDWCTFDYGTVEGDDVLEQQAECSSCHPADGSHGPGTTKPRKIWLRILPKPF